MPTWPALFRNVADALARDEKTILSELAAAQGRPADLGGYYHPDADKLAKVMRPSGTFNAVVDGLQAI